MEMTGMETKQNDVQKERLEQQNRFIIEVDKVKNIFRQTYLPPDMSGGRAAQRE